MDQRQPSKIYDLIAVFFAGLWGMFWLSIWVGSFFAWCTHVWVTISNESWVLLVIGGIILPIGVVHGVGIWLGFF